MIKDKWVLNSATYIYTDTSDYVVRHQHSAERVAIVKKKANANLIASAPDLYEACKAAKPLVGYTTTKQRLAHAQISQALAKAEGKC